MSTKTKPPKAARFSPWRRDQNGWIRRRFVRGGILIEFTTQIERPLR